MIPSWARVGAKVVRVTYERPANAPRFINDLGLRWAPSLNETYTISGTEVDPIWGCFISLVECPDGRRQAFLLRAFRPLVAPKSEAEDAEFFRHWLTAPQHSTASETEHAVDA